MIGDLEEAITSHIAGLLLRYYRPASPMATPNSRTEFKRDMDLLRIQWSLSDNVAELCSHILHHRHETQSFLATIVREDSGAIRGRIDARATLINRIVGQDPSMTTFHEPKRSFNSGPNQVTAWVLQQAWLLAKRFTSKLPSDAAYRDLAEKRSTSLAKVRKIEAIQSAMLEVDLVSRPGAAALRAAAQSRRKTYRLAYNAYKLLALIEVGDKAAIGEMLEGTLLGPLEAWRRFELAAGLSVAEALGTALGAPINLSLLEGDNRTPIITVGKFAIYWQTVTPWYTEPAAEPLEIVAQEVISELGLRADSDRPDLVVADLDRDAIVSVIEVKFFTADAEDARDRLREAAHQVVRYSRGYRELNEIGPLISNSIIMLARRPDLPKSKHTPEVFSFQDIKERTKIEAWAATLG